MNVVSIAQLSKGKSSEVFFEMLKFLAGNLFAVFYTRILQLKTGVVSSLPTCSYFQELVPYVTDTRMSDNTLESRHIRP